MEEKIQEKLSFDEAKNLIHAFADTIGPVFSEIRQQAKEEEISREELSKALTLANLNDRVASINAIYLGCEKIMQSEVIKGHLVSVRNQIISVVSGRWDNKSFCELSRTKHITNVQLEFIIKEGLEGVIEYTKKVYQEPPLPPSLYEQAYSKKEKMTDDVLRFIETAQEIVLYVPKGLVICFKRCTGEYVITQSTVDDTHYVIDEVGAGLFDSPRGLVESIGRPLVVLDGMAHLLTYDGLGKCEKKVWPLMISYAKEHPIRFLTNLATMIVGARASRKTITTQETIVTRAANAQRSSSGGYYMGANFRSMPKVELVTTTTHSLRAGPITASAASQSGNIPRLETARDRISDMDTMKIFIDKKLTTLTKKDFVSGNWQDSSSIALRELSEQQEFIRQSLRNLGNHGLFAHKVNHNETKNEVKHEVFGPQMTN